MEDHEDHAFISIDQSAYLKRHSTQTSLHRVIDDWLEQIHDNSLTGACLLDISKCFDSINHEILLKKLEMYGITGNELDWFSSYLKNRKQMVFFQEDSSDFQEVYSGVPQGSVLRPLLFLLFINDFSNFTTEGCALNMYADDMIIYTSAETSDELQMKLQLCVDNVHQWYNMNRLTVNKRNRLLSRVTLYTAGHLHTAVPHCWHSRAPIVHTAVPRENNGHGCVYLRCRAVCKLPGCVEGHPWLWWLAVKPSCNP